MVFFCIVAWLKVEYVKQSEHCFKLQGNKKKKKMIKINGLFIEGKTILGIYCSSNHKSEPQVILHQHKGTQNFKGVSAVFSIVKIRE